MIGRYARRFCFARPPTSSIESLPVAQFPDSIFLRSTQQRWLRDGTLRKLFEVGAKAQARMERQYDNEIPRLTWERAAVSGRRRKPYHDGRTSGSGERARKFTS